MSCLGAEKKQVDREITREINILYEDNQEKSHHHLQHPYHTQLSNDIGGGDLSCLGAEKKQVDREITREINILYEDNQEKSHHHLQHP